MTQDRALCRRCGQPHDIKDMTVYDTGNVPWYMCAICGDDMDMKYDA